MKKPILFFIVFITLLHSSIIKHSQNIEYSGKPIMLIFDSSNCPYCKKLKEDLIQNKYLNTIAKEFDIYSIPRDDHKSYMILGNETTTQSLQMLYKIKVTPNIVILSSKGEKIWQLPGYAKPYVLGKIMEFVKGIEEGKYKKSQWRSYLKSNGVI